MSEYKFRVQIEFPMVIKDEEERRRAPTSDEVRTWIRSEWGLDFTSRWGTICREGRLNRLEHKYGKMDVRVTKK